MNNKPVSISIIICAYTEERWDDLNRAIASIRNQEYKSKECILVIDNNEALYEKSVQSFPDCTVIQNTNQRGLSGARNSGLQRASGDVIAFMDEDAAASPEWLALLAAQYEDEKVIGAGGGIEPNWITGRPGWFPNEYDWVVGCSYLGLPQNTAPVRNLIGCNMSFRKEVFDNVGGFVSNLGRIGKTPLGCEETELSIRARQFWPDRQIIYTPEAKVLHNVPGERTKFKYFISRCYSEGISKAAVSKLVGSKDSLDSEWNYVLHDLPKGIVSDIKDSFVDKNFEGFLRAGAIITGLLVTTYGYLLHKAFKI